MQQIEATGAHPCIEIWECDLPSLRHIKITPDNDLGISANISAPMIRPDYYWVHETLCRYRARISTRGPTKNIKITPTNYMMINTLLNDLPALKDYLLSLPSEPSQADIDYENRNHSPSMAALAHDHLRGIDINTKPKGIKKKVVKSKAVMNQPDLFEMA